MEKKSLSKYYSRMHNAIMEEFKKNPRLAKKKNKCFYDVLMTESVNANFKKIAGMVGKEFAIEKYKTSFVNQCNLFNDPNYGLKDEAVDKIKASQYKEW